jgi:hypothetical protein
MSGPAILLDSKQDDLGGGFLAASPPFKQGDPRRDLAEHIPDIASI